MSNSVVTHLGHCITSVLQYVERSVDFLLKHIIRLYDNVRTFLTILKSADPKY